MARVVSELEARRLEDAFAHRVSWDDLRALCVRTPPREWESALRGRLDSLLAAPAASPSGVSAVGDGGVVFASS